MDRTRPDRSRACSELFLHSSHEFRTAAASIGAASACSMAGSASVRGTACRRLRGRGFDATIRRFDLDRNRRCGSSAPMPAFWGVVRSFPKREISPPSGFAWMAASKFPAARPNEARFPAVVFRLFFLPHHRSLAGDQYDLRRSLPGPGWRLPRQVPRSRGRQPKGDDRHTRLHQAAGSRGAPVRRKIAIGAAVRVTAGPSAGCQGFTPASRRASAS